ncbi:hypothetical protein GW924_00825 [Candidatus Pacearchaeota archaeon]|nr:hypothetical protein [Candidatus Pacearchaeota archaeon]
MEEEKRLKMAVIAGAAEAAKFKDKNWKASQEDVIRHITEKVDEILKNIDNPFD